MQAWFSLYIRDSALKCNIGFIETQSSIIGFIVSVYFTSYSA